MVAVEFRTFTEMATVLARNTPHALVLDWWRRLDRAIVGYFAARGLPPPEATSAEETLRSDQSLGPEVADQVRRLRRFRNRVAHEDPWPLSADTAFRYAEDAWHLSSRIARRGAKGASRRPN